MKQAQHANCAYLNEILSYGYLEKLLWPLLFFKDKAWDAMY